MPELETLALLRKFEPILKFTQGERFYPFNVSDYVREASLWVKEPEKPPLELISEENLDLDALGELSLKGAENIHYLHFISPMNLGELAEFRLNELRQAVKNKSFHPSRSRLARVGYLARFLDVIFSLSLLLRGRVPGDAMAAAVDKYRQMLAQRPEYQYYGRVIEQSGWIILQYWYFYPFNNWRTGFFGANDHEADWEMVDIYCYKNDSGEVRPAWLGYACHNFTGDDLRRHWDHPDVEKVGDHPVVYVGGGSHASYFQKGEYLTELNLPFLAPLRRLSNRIEKTFGQIFKENSRIAQQREDQHQRFAIPFVDYALGDGLCVGQGCESEWAAPVLLDPEPAWVVNYRGLWGYYAQDPYSGEDAPAGPMYNRDGSVRQAWYDPLGWAGMDRIVPPPYAEELLTAQIEGIQNEIDDLKLTITRLQNELYRVGIEQAAIQDQPHLQEEAHVRAQMSRALQDNLHTARRQLSVKESVLKSLGDYQGELSKGGLTETGEYVEHGHHPQVKQSLRFNKLAEFWAATSIGAMMIGLVLLVIFARHYLLIGIAGMLFVMLTFEAAFRKRLWLLVRRVSIGLAAVAAVILLFEFFWVLVLIILMLIGFYMIVENLRELFARE